ncbi:MAG: autotransporter assembly complex protein TamA [Alkalilacustris sp.]
MTVDDLRRGVGRLGVAAMLAVPLVFVSPPSGALERVTLEAPGAGGALERGLRSASLLLEAEAAGVTDPQELLAAARAEYGRMVAVLYGGGYYGGTVSVRLDGREAADFDALDVPRAVREITVDVDLGPRFVFSRAEVAPLAPDTELPSGFAPGEVARSDLIRQATSWAVDGWRAAGHATAAPGEARIIADHRSAELDARVPIIEGPQVRFGTLVLRGNERMRPNRVRKIAGFPEGEVFDPEAITQAAQRLRRTGSFTSVALSEAATLGPGNTIDVTATMVEAPLRRFGFGAELDTDDGARVSAFWLHRNLLGGAERLRVDGEVGSIGSSISGQDYRFSVQLSRPATFTPETTLTLSALAETVNERDFDARRINLEAGVSHIFTDRLTGDLGIGYLFERARDVRETRSRSALTLPAGLRYDARDDETDARRGYLLDARALPFYGLRGSSSGGQIRLDARGFVPVGDRVVLAGRAQLGSVVGASLEDTPRQLLFLSGGSGTVRGQPYRVLGVERPAPGGQTVRIGGRGFAGVSGEVRVAARGNIGVVGFADAGLVSASSFLSDGDWHAGAGVGLRYATGIGPIRVDVAAPVAGDTGSGLQLYIGIGQAF